MVCTEPVISEFWDEIMKISEVCHIWVLALIQKKKKAEMRQAKQQLFTSNARIEIADVLDISLSLIWGIFSTEEGKISNIHFLSIPLAANLLLAELPELNTQMLYNAALFAKGKCLYVFKGTNKIFLCDNYFLWSKALVPLHSICTIITHDRLTFYM